MHTTHAEILTRPGAGKAVQRFSVPDRAMAACGRNGIRAPAASRAALHAEAWDYFARRAPFPRLLAFVILTSSFILTGHAVPLSGTKSVGPTGKCASLTAAIADVNAIGNGLGGALVLELQARYVSTVETFPLTIPALTGASATNTLTIRPGGVLGTLNGVDYTTLEALQLATGQDATSAVGDPLFVNPSGTANTVDLHLQPGNSAEGQGIPIAALTDDFDGQMRAALTPTDIGVDAGNFALASDIFAPDISYPPLTSGTTTNRVLTGWATITDTGGTVADGPNAPRLYFKKSTDADVFGGNTSADNGWKYVTATGSGPYNFTLDYTLINGGSVSVGNTIQYFVVAQDAANNFGSSPAGATSSANPPVQNVNAKPGTGVNSFNIVASISGTKTVGTGGDYPSLTGAGGLFAAINSSVLTGDVVVNIISDLTENGSVTLDEFRSGQSIPPTDAYTLTLRPDSATMRTISGPMSGGLVTLNGADRVTIDGSFGGSGRFLTFRNTIRGGFYSTIVFVNDASNNTVRNCIVEGSSGVISFSTGAVTGNDNNLITGCQLRDRSDADGAASVLISCSVGSDAAPNSGNTISNNELFNFTRVGIAISPIGNTSWTISGNDIYEVNTLTPDWPDYPVGIEFGASGTNYITGNFIHDLLTTNRVSRGMLIYGAGTTTISRNRITATNVNAATTTVIGIQRGPGGPTLNVVNNQITLSPATSVSRSLYGLYDIGSGAGVVNAFHNSIVIGGTESGTRSSWASYRNVASTHTARNNLFLNLRTGGTGSHFAAGSEVTGGSYTASNNVYAGTGATAANFMDFSGTANTAVPVSFATWQSSTGDTGSQAGIAGSGSFTTAMFVNAATGDLHLVPGGNALVNGLGIPIAGVTDDFDGDLRSPITPTIGSDEAQVSDIAVTQTSAVADGGSIDFGPVTLGSSGAAKTFTITNPGSADLTGLAFAPKDAANPGDFTVSALSGTTVPVGSGSVTFTVTFTPGASGARSAGIHITSNVSGAKNPYDIMLTGTGQTVFAEWATGYGVPTDPAANGGANLQAFAFGLAPGVGTTLVFNGTFGAGGTIGTYGMPLTWLESVANGVDVRMLYIRRKDAASIGLSYAVEFAAVLGTWTEVGGPTVLADDGTYQIVSVPYPPFVAGKEAGFSRVRVTLAP